MLPNFYKNYLINSLEDYFFDSLYSFGFLKYFPPVFSEGIDDEYLSFLSRYLNFEKTWCEGFFYAKEFHDFEGGSFYRLYAVKANLKNIRDELENILVLRDIFENLNKLKTLKNFDGEIKLRVNYLGNNEIEKNRILEFLDLHFEVKKVWDDGLNNDKFDGLYFEWFSDREGYEFKLAEGGKRKNFDGKFSFFYIDIWEFLKFVIFYRDYLLNFNRKVVLFFDKEDKNVLEFRKICRNQGVCLICFERSSDDFSRIYDFEINESNWLVFWYCSRENLFRYYHYPITNGFSLEGMRNFEKLDSLKLEDLQPLLSSER